MGLTYFPEQKLGMYVLRVGVEWTEEAKQGEGRRTVHDVWWRTVKE